MRPGQQGFCTVATSAGIPKPLWDRLESVSGYRHPFEAAAGRSRNPVAWAHWLIQVGGREVSVLSRVCDAGLDYTQRTNTFAHHLALEPDERAAGGPAWMLRRDGVMAARWDGRVGTISRPAPLPGATRRPPPCAAWQRADGRRRVGGRAGRDGGEEPPPAGLHPVQAGAGAAAADRRGARAAAGVEPRWQVTFNTYFTSLPGNAVCAWRCCLEGTPAAAEAARHAAGGLVLDLAHPERLGAPPAGPWVDLARSGRGTVKAPPTAAPRFTLPGRRALTEIPIARGVEPETTAEPSVFDAPPAPRPRAWAGKLRDLSSAGVGEPAGESRVLDTSWGDRRRQTRRLWLAGLCGLSLAFVAAGTWLQVSAYHASSSRPLPAEPPATQPLATAAAPAPAPVAPVVPAPRRPPAKRRRRSWLRPRPNPSRPPRRQSFRSLRRRSY